MQMAFGILGCTFSICVIVYFVAVGVFWGLVMVCGSFYLVFCGACSALWSCICKFVFLLDTSAYPDF